MNNFVALSVVGGSLNTWGTTLNTLLQAGGIGALTAELYNDSGTLKLSKGKIGIDNGVATGIGVCIIDTITTISTAGMTAELWHAIEVSVSGTSVTIDITPIAGASDESVIDSATKVAYDYEKTGYYLTASKRLIGVVFLRTALALGRVVNCESGKLGFKGITIEDYVDMSGVRSKKYYALENIEIGSWDMDTNAGLNVTLPYKITGRIAYCAVTVRADSDATPEASYFLAGYNGAGGAVTGGPYLYTPSVGIITLGRAAGTTFDSASFNATPYNRAFMKLQWES